MYTGQPRRVPERQLETRRTEDEGLAADLASYLAYPLCFHVQAKHPIDFDTWRNSWPPSWQRSWQISSRSSSRNSWQPFSSSFSQDSRASTAASIPAASSGIPPTDLPLARQLKDSISVSSRAIYRVVFTSTAIATGSSTVRGELLGGRRSRESCLGYQNIKLSELSEQLPEQLPEEGTLCRTELRAARGEA